MPLPTLSSDRIPRIFTGHLSTCPIPLIHLRKQYDNEYKQPELQFPELVDLDRERTPEQWDGDIATISVRIPQTLGRLLKLRSSAAPPNSPMGKQMHRLPHPRRLNRTHSIVTFPIRKMLPPVPRFTCGSPVSHENQRHVEGQGRRDAVGTSAVAVHFRHVSRGSGRPFSVRQSAVPSAPSKSRLPTNDFEKSASIGRACFEPAVSSIAQKYRSGPSSSGGRNLFALRVIEALRIYAASHDGRLPDKLDDVKEVPIPNDPGTGKPFEYSRDGDTATLISQIPNDPYPNNGIRYRVTIRK